MATTVVTAAQPPITWTYVAYTVTTITASPMPALAATITFADSWENNGTKTTTSGALTCTPSCLKMDSDGSCMKIQGCDWEDFRPTGFGVDEIAQKGVAPALNLWRDPGARLAAAVLGVSWLIGVAMVKVF